MKSLKIWFVFLWYSLLVVTLTACQIGTPTPSGTNTDPSGQKLYFDEWKYSCDTTGMTFTVKWTDRATNESGYRIFRDGEKLAELPPNSTSYTDTFNPPAGQSVEYYLQVFGPDGTVNSSVMKMSC